MPTSKTRKIVSCFFFLLALISASFLFLPLMFANSEVLQPIAFFGSVLTDFLDFFAYLLPFYFLAEGLLILFRKSTGAGGKLLLMSICPLSLLSVFVQLAGGRAPVLTSKLGGADNHLRLILLTVAVFAALATEIALFIWYAVLLFNANRGEKKQSATPSLTDGIEYGRKPKTLSARLKNLKQFWQGFLSTSNEHVDENPESASDFDDNRMPTHNRRAAFSRLKTLFFKPEEKPALRSMDAISYPNPEDRPRFNSTPMPPPEYTYATNEPATEIPETTTVFETDDFEAESEEWDTESEIETQISVPDDRAPFAYFDTDEADENELNEESTKETAPFSAAENEIESHTAVEVPMPPLQPPTPTPTKAKTNRRSPAYKPPTKDMLLQHQETQYWIIDEDTKESAEILRRTLEEFGIQAQVTGITRGPVVTMFELLPAPGVKLSKIANLADNIALRLAAGRVRIVAPIPGKHAVGIEVPNRKRALVSFKELIEDPAFKKSNAAIPVILGKDITGETQVIDLTSTPHLLIAGSTGSGKSVCVNSIITSVLYKKSPEEVRMILIDPKIVELKMYNDIPHLLTPVITDAKRAYMALQYGLSEMERRYNLLDALGARNIESYNKKAKESGMTAPHLPYILIVIDEFADLMTANRKDLEQAIARLAAMSRAVGIHLILATQRPSVDVITGLIKANIPSRIAFMTASKIDSRTILDTVGAEKLLGKGDMLFVSSSNPYPSRIQGTFLSEAEVETVTDYVKSLGEPDYLDDEIFMDETEIVDDDGDDDPNFDEALQIVVQTGKASASYLQRRLSIGYNRAARMIETMEARGYIGPQNGSKPREVFIDRIEKG